MLGEPVPLPFLKLRYNAASYPCHCSFKKSQVQRKRCTAGARAAPFITVLTDANHESTALRASTYLLS